MDKEEIRKEQEFYSSWMKQELPKIGYIVEKDCEEALVMKKESAVCRMNGLVGLLFNNEKGNGMVFGAHIEDESGNLISCPEYFGNSNPEAKFCFENPDFFDVQRVISAEMESFLSARTNSHEVLELCMKYKRKGVNIKSTGYSPRILKIGNLEYEIVNIVLSAPGLNTEQEKKIALLLSETYSLNDEQSLLFKSAKKPTSGEKKVYKEWERDMFRHYGKLLESGLLQEGLLSNNFSGKEFEAENCVQERLLRFWKISEDRFYEIQNVVLHHKFPDSYPMPCREESRIVLKQQNNSPQE